MGHFGLTSLCPVTVPFVPPIKQLTLASSLSFSALITEECSSTISYPLTVKNSVSCMQSDILTLHITSKTDSTDYTFDMFKCER